MSEILTVDDIRWNKGWRDEEEERQARRLEKQERELAEERERKATRKAREAEKQPAASTNWWTPIDDRLNEHLKNWLWGAIDDRIRQNLEHHFFSGDLGVGGAVIGGLKDGIAEIVGKLRAQVQGLKADSEKQQCSFEAKLTEQKERFQASNSDGEQWRAQLCEELKRALVELTDALGGQLAALERRLRAVPGRLPVAKTYCPDTVHYAGHVVVHRGATYQALRDTARAPPHVDDWICIASAGRDAITPTMRGTFNVYKKYAQLDVVEYDGASYVARRDNPGVCPGDGWQSLSRSGRRGPAGETGPRGKKGEKGEKGDAPEIVGWHLERETYRAFPVLADGKMGPELNLRPLFEQFFLESYAVE